MLKEELVTNLPAIIQPGLPALARIGIHHDVSADRYHADDFGGVPTLSSSIAKILIVKTPAHARLAHCRLNQNEDEAEDDGRFDLGSAAHEMILGKGGGIDVLDFADWKTKASKEARAATRAVGRTPMLKAQYERARLVMEGALAHPQAPYRGGHAETVLVWRDIGGPLCRAMLDHWDGGTMVTDCKISDIPLTDDNISRQIGSLAYDISAGFYLRGLAALQPEIAGRVRFRWHFIEASAPHSSRMIEATNEMLSMGDRKAAIAIATWRRCLASKTWESWPTSIDQVPSPWRYVEKQMELEMAHPDAGDAVFTDAMPAYEPRKLMEPI